MYFLSSIVAIIVLVNARRKDGGLKPLRWPLAIFLAALCAVAVAATGALSSVAVNKLFLFVLHWTRGTTAHITWFSRTEIILSNGDHFGQGTSQILQIVGLFLWAALFALSFFIARFFIRCMAPYAYLEYARYLRQWVHLEPRPKQKK